MKLQIWFILFEFAWLSVARASVAPCIGSSGPNACTVPIVYGIDLNTANNGIGLAHFKGTLDSLLNTTPLEYDLYKSGKIGWDMSTDALESSGLTSPTSRSCYDPNYFCPPGPCSVLDINYLSDINYYGIEYVKENFDAGVLLGKSFCGPVFGTRMKMTRTGEIVPNTQDHKTALRKLPGSLPSEVQNYIPSNDIVNDIPAWWYDKFDDWVSGDKTKLRKNGKPCIQRAVPEWMIPYAQVSRGKTNGFSDEDNSNSETKMQKKNTTDDTFAAEGQFGSRLDLPSYEGNKEYFPYYTLCDSDFLKGVFLGYDARQHRQLRLNAEFEQLYHSLDKRTIVNFDDDTVKTIIQAVKFYFESYSKSGKFCQGGSASTCDFPSFLYERWKDLHTVQTVCATPVVGNQTCSLYNTTMKGTVDQRNVASLAMMAGQIFSIIRPCESFRSRQGKMLAATFNHWRRGHFNPGNNRAAFEHGIGCDVASSDQACSDCRAVRKEIEWQTPSSCVPIGGCSTVGFDCCTATGAPALAQDTRSASNAPEFMAYAYSTEELSDECKFEIGNEENIDEGNFPSGSSTTGAPWPYKLNKDGKETKRKLMPFKCGIKMEIRPKERCKKTKFVTTDTTRLYAVPLCLSVSKKERSNYDRLFNTKDQPRSVVTVEQSIFTAYGLPVTSYTDEKALTACRNHLFMSAYYTFLANCVVNIVGNRFDPTKGTDLNQLVSDLKSDGFGNASQTQQHCGIMTLPFLYPGGASKLVYKTCVEEEQNWDVSSGPFIPTSSTSELSWQSMAYRSVFRVRKRYLPVTPFQSPSQPVEDTSMVGLDPRGWEWRRKSSIYSDHHKEIAGRCTYRSGLCAIAKTPPDLKLPQLLTQGRFMQNGMIKQGTGPDLIFSSECRGRFTLAAFSAIMKSAEVFELYDATKGRDSIADSSSVGESPGFGKAALTQSLGTNSTCGWSTDYTQLLVNGGGHWVNGAVQSFTYTYKGTPNTLNNIQTDGYWLNIQVESLLGNTDPDNLPIYHYENAETVDCNQYAQPTLERAKTLCLKYRYLDCIGVQEVVVTGKNDFYLISLGNLVRGKKTYTPGAKFYPVPCYSIETQNDLYGCNENPRVRPVSVNRPLDPAGTPLWLPLSTTYVGASESYLLDGLGHFSGNSRFTLNKTSFIENKLGEGMATEFDRANGISMDFDIHQWQDTIENRNHGQRIHLPSFMGPGGLALNHYEGVRHVPVQSSGILDDKQKTMMFSWAGMFDTDGWTLERKYRFQHPSHKYSDSFLYYPPSSDSGIEVSLESFGNIGNVTFKIDDVLIRAMTREKFDPNNATHKEQWVNYFFDRVVAVAKSKTDSISSVSCQSAYILVGSTFEQTCSFNLTNYTGGSAANEFESTYFDPYSFRDGGTTWSDFTSKYESLCDLHACDIVQTVPRVAQEATLSSDVGTDLPLGYNCVPKGYSYFQRGASPVDASLNMNEDKSSFLPPSTSMGSHIQSAFGYLGYSISSIEASILRSVILARYKGKTSEAGIFNSWKDAVKDSKFIDDLWYACSRIAGENGVIFDDTEVCIDVIKAQAVRGYPDTIVMDQFSNEAQPPKNPVQTPASVLSMFVSDESRWNDLVDYSAIDTSDLYEEHREAIPVSPMDRSASYSNLEQNNNAIPCDCDNQGIVWMCNRIRSEGTDSPMADSYNFSNDVPQSSYWSKPADYGDSIQLVECGYSWAVPPMRTPRIGLYVPSKIDLFEVFERDIFSGYRHEDVSGECSALLSNPFLNSTSTNNTCAERARLSSLLRLCATEIFSIPMAPKAKKLQNLLFTGRHPVVSGLASQNDAEDLHNDGFLSDSEYEEILEDLNTATNADSAICWQKQELTVYDSPCLRYPFGVAHRSTLGYNDNETAFYLRQLFNDKNYGTFDEGSNRKFYNAHRIKTVGWQGYCEVETEASNLKDDYSVFDTDQLKFRYCQNDPLSLLDREKLCSSLTPHFVMYGWTLTDRRVKNACSQKAKLCIVIPGYASSGLISSIMESSDLTDVREFTFLVMPFHYDIISEYFANRVLYEVGNSFGRSLDFHIPDVTDEMRKKFRPKHPLDLKPRETTTFSDADVQLNDTDSSFTGLPVDVDAFSILARVPDDLTVDEARRLLTIISAQINNTCRIKPASSDIIRSRWPTCKSDADRMRGTFLMPSLTNPPTDDNLRELSIDEVYRPYPADKIIVDVPGITIMSGVKTMPLRFDPNPFVDRLKNQATCNHIQVGEQSFMIRNAVFNQTACVHLSPSQQVPIIFSGTDVSNGYMEARVIFNGSFPSTIGTGALVLGDDNRVFGASSVLTADNMKFILDLVKEGDKKEIIKWDDASDLYFQVAVAKTIGDINVIKYNGAEEDLQRTVLIQERKERDGSVSGPKLLCADNNCHLSNISMYTCSNGTHVPRDACRLFNVTQATGIFGSSFESEIYHELPSHTNWYIASAVLLSIFGFIIIVLNFGLLYVGDKIVHRMIGLHPPLSHDDIAHHFTHEDFTKKKKSKMYFSKTSLRPGQWKVTHANNKIKRFIDTTYGNIITLASGEEYAVELLARDVRNGTPLPIEVTREYPKLVEKLKEYNKRIA